MNKKDKINKKDSNKQLQSKLKSQNSKTKNIKLNEENYQAMAYTNGGSKNGIFTSGAVLIYNSNTKNKIYKEFKDKYNNAEFAKSQNVAGEIMAVIKIIFFCEDEGIKSVLIHHDYKGLSEWASNNWKSNIKLTQQYKYVIDNTIIKIAFKWVTSDSRNDLNYRADQLSCEAHNNKAFSKC